MTVDPLEIPNPIVVQTTVAAEADAQTFARGLVERGFAACVQWTPITSMYRWQGKIEQSNEWQLTIKTIPSRVQDVIGWLQRHHTYTNPEILVLGVVQTSAAYARWVTEATMEDNTT
jgi:periplasmic divalent cation tolerance protein